MIEKNVTVDGHRLHYRSAGCGPPLLLLHALGESSYSWLPVLAGLAARHTVLAPDLPGFAGSEPVPGRPTPQRLADVAAGFLRALGLARATVVGNSLGGTAALHLALREPERVARLVLVASAGLGRRIHPALSALTVPGYGDLTVALAGTPLGAAQRAWLRVPLLFSNPALAPPDWVAEHHRLAHLPQHLATTLAALRAQVSPLGQRQVLLPALSRLAVPTLLLWGADDRVVPVGQAGNALGRLVRGHVDIVPRCGHLPQLERPERFLAAIDRFMDEA
jgi:pimeloyl-ACP methyl ester carboxylesterase